jgi:hypothetical protein
MADENYSCNQVYKCSSDEQALKSRSRSSKLDEIDVELYWVQGLKDQVEFLNANIKHYCILFKVQRREFVIGGAAY